MKETSEIKQQMKPWKVIAWIIALGLILFAGYVVGNWIGLIIGIVIWVAIFAALTSSKIKSK